jgi:hypothetical protein
VFSRQPVAGEYVGGPVLSQVPVVDYNGQSLLYCHCIDGLIQSGVRRSMQTRVFAVDPAEVGGCVDQVRDIDV